MLRLSLSQCRGLVREQCHRFRRCENGLRSSAFRNPARKVNTLAVSMASYPDWMYQLLLDNSTDKYRIEYDSNGLMLSNHLAHGVIALCRLGADKSRAQQYIDHYATKLDVPTEDDFKDDVKDVKDLLGKLTRFTKLVEHYQARLKHLKGDLQALIEEELPKLAPGLANSALHGFIHLGYGWSVRSEKIVLEGLSYLHFAYVPLGLQDDLPGPDLRSLGKGSEDIVAVLDRVRANVALSEAMLEESEDPLKTRNKTRFQNKVGAIMDFHAPVLLEYVHSIKFPDFWDPTKVTQEQTTLICQWILDCAITVYVKAQKKNDFFLIHGVTAAWSMYQLLPVVRDEVEVLKTVRVFLASIVAVFVTQSTPELDWNEEVEKDFPELLKETVAKERDEHIYKLVQVCWERSQENPAQKELYMKACGKSLKYELGFK